MAQFCDVAERREENLSPRGADCKLPTFSKVIQCRVYCQSYRETDPWFANGMMLMQTDHLFVG